MAFKHGAVNRVTERFDQQASPSLGAVLAAIRSDLQQFAQTRFELFKAEVQEKSKAWKTALVAFSIALTFAGAAFFLITATLVSFIAIFLGTSLALLSVSLLYLGIAGMAGWSGYNKLKAKPFVPERTLEVLKEDRTWLRNQAGRT